MYVYPLFHPGIFNASRPYNQFAFAGLYIFSFAQERQIGVGTSVKTYLLKVTNFGNYFQLKVDFGAIEWNLRSKILLVSSNEPILTVIVADFERNVSRLLQRYESRKLQTTITKRELPSRCSREE